MVLQVNLRGLRENRSRSRSDCALVRSEGHWFRDANRYHPRRVDGPLLHRSRPICGYRRAPREIADSLLTALPRVARIRTALVGRQPTVAMEARWAGHVQPAPRLVDAPGQARVGASPTQRSALAIRHAGPFSSHLRSGPCEPALLANPTEDPFQRGGITLQLRHGNLAEIAPEHRHRTPAEYFHDRRVGIAGLVKSTRTRRTEPVLFERDPLLR